MQKSLISKRVFNVFLHSFTKVKITHQSAVFLTFFFSNLSPQRLLKRMQNVFISRFFYVFSSHLPKLKLLKKTSLYGCFFSNLSSRSVSKRIQIAFILKTGFARVLHAFTKVRIAKKRNKNADFSRFFFLLDSTKCFKTHAKCNYFTTFLPVFCTHLPK